MENLTLSDKENCLDQIRREKLELEVKIGELLNDFVNDTEIEINYISVEPVWISRNGKRQAVQHIIQIEVKL